MEDAKFHTLADEWLENLQEVVENKDESGVLEVDLEQGMLTIALPEGKPYLISKHSTMQQLWVSSPRTGGLHFSYVEDKHHWVLPDGRTLDEVVRTELNDLAGISL